MSNKRPKRSKTSRKHPYQDGDDLSDLSLTELRSKLKEIGINVPNTLSKTVLKQLYLENYKKDNSVSNDVVEPVEQEIVRDTPTHDTQNVPSANVPASNNDMVTVFEMFSQTVSKCFTGLQQTMNNFVQQNGGTTTATPTPSFNLAESSSRGIQRKFLCNKVLYRLNVYNSTKWESDQTNIQM